MKECKHTSMRISAKSASTNALRRFAEHMAFKPWNRMVLRQELRKRGET